MIPYIHLHPPSPFAWWTISVRSPEIMCRIHTTRAVEFGNKENLSGMWSHKAQSKSRIGPVPFSTSVLCVQWPRIPTLSSKIGLDHGYCIPLFDHSVQRFNLRFGSVCNFKLLVQKEYTVVCTQWELWVNHSRVQLNYYCYDRAWSCIQNNGDMTKCDLHSIPRSREVWIYYVQTLHSLYSVLCTVVQHMGTVTKYGALSA